VSGTPLPALVDPHVHLWDLSRDRYAWLQDDPLPNNPAGDMSPIARRDYLLDDYLSDAGRWPVEKIVHVECGLPRGAQVGETAWLQAMADRRGYPQGIVAGADLLDPGIERVLARHVEHANVRGIRQIVSWHREPAKTYTAEDLLGSHAWRAAFALLSRYGLVFDLQIYPSQMATAATLAAEHPESSIVVNHAGLPTDRNRDGVERWRSGLRLLAARPNVSIKISGLGMVDRAWTVDSIRPFVLEAIDAFGPARSMFASNFPVEKVHGSFDSIYRAYDEITRGFGDGERARLFGGTAEAVYRI
jgi:predicted TIM-barrel fold metal-dependent hydrolase